jgi:hypothetical protein
MSTPSFGPNWFRSVEMEQSMTRHLFHGAIFTFILFIYLFVIAIDNIFFSMYSASLSGSLAAFGGACGIVVVSAVQGF